MLFVRSLLFWAGLILSTIIAAPIVSLLYPLPYRLRYRHAYRWTCFNLWWLKITCRLQCHITGATDIPQGAHIVMAKHQSAWETIALHKLFPPQVWIMKREIFWIPFFGWALATMHTIAIDRSASRKALAQIIEQGKKKLAQGYWIIFFPEGTRVPPGSKGHYKLGAALLATQSGYPVIPVAHNAGEFWKRGVFIKQPGIIDVVIGEPIDSKNLTANALNKKVEEWIEGEMKKISITPYTGELYRRNPRKKG